MTEPVTILAVDDQPANLRLLDAVLSPRGYRVIRASSGEQALELLPSSGVDLVLLDIVMPGIDGYEVCRRIRSAPDTAFLPVVMVTASGNQEKIRAIEAGADDFVSKPFDQSELLARVASLARIKRYHDTITEQAAELAQAITHRVRVNCKLVGGRGNRHVRGGVGHTGFAVRKSVLTAGVRLVNPELAGPCTVAK